MPNNAPAKSRYARSVDMIVGQNIRDQRSLQGKTQEWIASALGISYQQVQKYETGSNRVSAGRLYEICQHLHISVASLYRGAERFDADAPPAAKGSLDPMVETLIGNFQAVDSGLVRSALSGLVKSVAKIERAKREGLKSSEQVS